MDIKTLAYYAQSASIVASRYESVVSGLTAHFEAAFAPGTRILDLGFGSGRDMAHLLSMGRQAFGVDATHELVDIAQRLHPELKGRVAHGTLPNCPVPFGGQFDGVLCSAVLMHIPRGQLGATIDFVLNCLKPAGRFLYSVPSRRDDAGEEEHRDADGRLFVPDSGGLIGSLCEARGFQTLREWDDSDSLGRGAVEWRSVLLQKP